MPTRVNAILRHRCRRRACGERHRKIVSSSCLCTRVPTRARCKDVCFGLRTKAARRSHLGRQLEVRPLGWALQICRCKMYRFAQNRSDTTLSRRGLREHGQAVVEATRARLPATAVQSKAVRRALREGIGTRLPHRSPQKRYLAKARLLRLECQGSPRVSQGQGPLCTTCIRRNERSSETWRRPVT